MNEALKPFAKGTLPGWLTVMLLAIVTYMGRSLMEEFKETRQMTIQNDKRTAVLESQSEAVKASIMELRLGQKDVVSELRAIGAQLQQQKR